jgi:predicted MPP superfamily phosphohydrolase
MSTESAVAHSTPLPLSQPAERPRRPSRFIRNIVALIAFLHLYVGVRLLPDLPISLLGRLIGALAVCASFALIIAGARARRNESSRFAANLAWLGSLNGGFFSSLAVLTVMRDLFLGPAVLLSSRPEAATLETASAVAVPLLAALATLMGFVGARRRPRIVDVEVPLPGLPPALQGFTIAQISDVHIGPTIKRDFLRRIVESVNALEADLVAVTGDLVDGPVEQLAVHVEPLSRLRARHGAYFVTGNHEYYSGAAAWIAEVRRLGLRVLLNEHVVLNHRDASILIAGVTDYSAHWFDPTQRSDPEAALAGAPHDLRPRVLLAHQPRTAPAAADAGFDLQLSGHTHGGQFWPWNLFVRLQQPFTAGLHRLGELWVYTSRGTGYWGPPKRLGVPSEIARIRLVASR